MSDNWIRACASVDIGEEDLIRFDHGDKTYCIYNTPKGFYATDGMCTHEEEHLQYEIQEKLRKLLQNQNLYC